MNTAFDIDAYLALACGAQAQRRRVEAADLALGGALGVAAEPYPHQIATVKRILTDTRIRHLIADEVGLGKTVQALMILNALRWQNPSHKAVILMPNRLIDQWRKECWSRGHCQVSVFGDDASDARDPWVRLVRPESIASGAFRLQPEKYDLLMVDEPQLISSDVMDMVERAAPDFRQLLILSATPGLGDPAKRARMMAMLEPDRAAIAAANLQDLIVYLNDLEINAAVAQGRAVDMHSTSKFRAFSLDRRIMRATRSDWGRYLPKRRYEQLSVEPLHGERERIATGMKWLESVRQQGSRMDTWRAVQVLHRGTPSTRAIASGQNDPSGLLSKALAYSTESPGDSRFDALIDVLASLWTEDPTEQIIVVAGDNPTIDFLKPRLARYFQFQGKPVGIAELRREGERSDSEEADVRTMNEQLAPFTTGQSKVLLLGDWVQAGLNLHYFARNIVFYTTPWDSGSVDQLIGRLDRLRPNGLWQGDKGQSAGRIRIWTITQNETSEERAIAGLEALKVFERPVPPLTPAQTELIDSELKSLVFSGDRNGTARLSEIALHWADDSQRSSLGHFSPFTSLAAQAQYDALQARALPGPTLLTRNERDTLTSASERALRRWLDFISKSEIFDVRPKRDRVNQEVKFSTFWYRSKKDRFRPFQLAGVDGENWIEGHVPFILARRHLYQPPLITVQTDDGETGGRPLRFFDHGDEVHDSLVAGFIAYTAATCNPERLMAAQVAFDPRHPLLETCSGKVLAVASAYIDPGELAMPDFERATLAKLATEAPTEAQRAALSADIEQAFDWWLADQRWLRTCVSSKSYFSCVQLEGARWIPLPQEIAQFALMPMTEDRDSRCARMRGNPPKLSREVGEQGYRSALASIYCDFNSDRPALTAGITEELEQRCQILTVENEDLICMRTSILHKLRTGGSAVQEWAREGQIAAAERSLMMAKTMTSMRQRWLGDISVRLSQMKPKTVGIMMIRPAPFVDDY